MLFDKEVVLVANIFEYAMGVVVKMGVDMSVELFVFEK